MKIPENNKDTQLDSIFDEIDSTQLSGKQNTLAQNTTRLVLQALKEDERVIDGWNAFGKVGWNKAF